MSRSRHESSSRPASPVRFFRRAAGVLAVSFAPLAFTGCVGMDDMPVARPPVPLTGDPVVDGNAQLAAAPERDRVLWEYRVAAAALREGKYAEAKAKLDDAIRRMGGVISGPDDAARRARSLFTAENEKTFIGEPYERVMAFYYRGLLYWRDGQPDNARACFRSAQFIDSDAESASFKSDYVLLDYLDGLASTKLGADGRDAFARAQKLSKSPLPPYDPQANVLCFVEFGRGPRKLATGQYGEQLRFRVEPSRVRSVALSLVDENVHFLPWDNLNYQAITRGGRVMDYILGHKAVFKGTADAVGDLALAGAAVAADNIYKEKPRAEPKSDPKRDGKPDEKHDNQPEYEKSESAQNTAIALGVIGVFAKLTAAAAQPQADTRAWDNLPQYLSFSALRLPAGAHPAMLQFFDAEGHVVEALTRRLTIDVGDPARDTVVILSELNR